MPVIVPGTGGHTVYSLFRSKGRELVPGTVHHCHVIVWPPPTQVKPEPLVVFHDHDCERASSEYRVAVYD